MRFLVVAVVLAALMLIASRSRVPNPNAYLHQQARNVERSARVSAGR